MVLPPQDVASSDAWYWADLNDIKLSSGIFTGKNHEYQLEPMMGENRVVCYMKGTQGGFTEIEVLKSLWGMIYRRYPQGVLYLFPTNDDVLEFSKSRFQPLIRANRSAIGKFVRGTDMASLKRIHDAFLYLRGARLSQKAGETMESTKLRSIPVDRVVFDEVDLMDKDVIEKAKQRMGHSLIKEEIYISNPTEPNVGIDKIFQKSDQRLWHRKCSCGEWTCAEESFPDCVKTYSDGKGYIACSKCGKPLGIYPGEWVARYPDRKIVGYRWSQLTSVFNDPAEILEDFVNPPEGNLGDVYKLRLGLPWISKEDKLTIGQVLDCCNNDIMATSSKNQCAMGVDVGKAFHHVVIGIRTGKDRFELIKIVKVPDWPDIHDLARKFNVKSAVIDIRPYEDSARKFQKEEKYRVYLCEYTDNPLHEAVWDNKDYIVKVYRTGIFDISHRLVAERKVSIPRESPEIREFAKQVCSSFKKLDINKRTNTSVYRYRSEDDNDHFRNALNYFYLAASGGKIAKVENRFAPPRQKYAKNVVRI